MIAARNRPPSTASNDVQDHVEDLIISGEQKIMSL